MARSEHRIDAVREWILMTAPVALYVVAEHMFVDKHAFSWFESAEWGISTAFISLATILVLVLDVGELDDVHWTLRRSSAVFIVIAMTIVAILAVMVSMKLLDQRGDASPAPHADTTYWVARQWVLYVVATMTYLWIKMRVGYCRARRS